MTHKVTADSPSTPRRLSKDKRRRQLLEVALQIVREEDADRLTLGRLAERAGISKPVVYDHFPTRSALLIELYKWIDTERVKAFTDAMAAQASDRDEAVAVLASAYIHCAADTTDEFHVVGAALAGSEEKAAVFQELLDNCVTMFVSVLTPYSSMKPKVLVQRCVGLVGAGEALAAALARGRMSRADAVSAFTVLIKGAVH